MLVIKWIKTLTPFQQVIMLMTGVFMAGGASTLATVNALSLPKANAETIARVDSMVIDDHKIFDQRLNILELNQEELASRIRAQLCLSVAERDPQVPWQTCLDDEDLRSFRNDR